MRQQCIVSMGIVIPIKEFNKVFPGVFFDIYMDGKESFVDEHDVDIFYEGEDDVSEIFLCSSAPESYVKLHKFVHTYFPTHKIQSREFLYEGP